MTSSKIYNFGSKTLLNPFERYSEKSLLMTGVVAVVIGSLLVYFFNGRYDGVVDLHFAESVKLAEPFLDNAINVVCLLLPLLLLGKFINGKTRAVDILTAILIARIPYYVLPVFNANGFMQRITNELMRSIGQESQVAVPQLGSTDTIIIVLFAAASILALIWMVIILFNGFKTATNLKTLMHKFLFAIALIVAEILSKIIILKIITQTEL